MQQRSDGIVLIGRVLTAVLFIVSGWGKLNGFAGTTGYIASKGLPLPQVLAAVAVAAELGGGILLAIGFRTRLVAWGLVAFLVVITPLFHNFWDAPAAAAQAQQINFLKNLSILGGLLVIAGFGPGRFSVDRG